MCVCVFCIFGVCVCFVIAVFVCVCVSLLLSTVGVGGSFNSKSLHYLFTSLAPHMHAYSWFAPIVQ